MASLEHHDRAVYLIAMPLDSPIAIHAADSNSGIRVGEVVLHFVHPEPVTIVHPDPAWLKADIHDYKLYGTFAKKLSNIGCG